MNRQLFQLLEKNPVIAAVFDMNDLDVALQSPCEVIFLLCGDICSLESLISRARSSNKKMYIHLDLLGGFGKDIYTVKYIKQAFAPDGIITTKSIISKYANEVGLPVVQRMFMLDSKSFESAQKSLQDSDLAAVEILPGIIPTIIESISKNTKVPVIAGGLIRHKKEAIDCLNAGAMGVSTSCKAIWDI